MKKKKQSFVTREYPAPVSELLKLGRKPLIRRQIPDYLALGLRDEHRAELKILALDDDLFCEADEPEAFGPIHAWNALGQLHDPDDIPLLLAAAMLFEDTDWVGEMFPVIFAQFGPIALPALGEFLADETKNSFDGPWQRITAAHCVAIIGEKHRDARDECVKILTDQLKKHAANREDLNGFLVSYLLDLDASESLMTIDAAYTAGHVDGMVCGDLQDVREKFGLRAPGAPPKSKLLGSKEFRFLG